MGSHHDDTVRVGELGELRVVVGGRQRAIRGPRQAAVLSVLALRGQRGVRAERLVDLVWPASIEPEIAAPSLRNTIARLRGVLGSEAIESTPLGYRLHAEVQSERSEFLDHLDTARRGAAQGWWEEVSELASAALQLWRGSAWSGVDDIDEIETDRHHLAALRQELESLQASAWIELGNHGSAVALLRRLLRADPTNERLWEKLAVATRHNGSRVEAVRVIQSARRELAEAGMSIGVELSSLEAALLEEPSALKEPDRSDAAALPRYRTPLVGRRREIGEVISLLDAHPLVTITGAGGAGKTRLAVAVAEARLGTVRALNIGSIEVDHVAERLSCEAARADLLVVDNCESAPVLVGHVVDRLLHQHRDLRVLATSRQRLQVLGECVYALPRYAEAEELFIDRCDALGVRIESEFARRDTAGICDLVDDLPLAVELAASQIRLRSTSEILRSLREGAPVESALMHETRHRSIEAALEPTLGALSSDHLTACRRVAGCGDEFDLEAARRLLDRDDCRQLLDDLVGVSLLDLRRSERGCTYRMLNPIRQAVLRVS